MNNRNLWGQPIKDRGFPGGSDSKESACNTGVAGDMGSITGSGRSSGQGNGNSLWYSCLENAMDRGAWQATFHGIARVRHASALNFFFLIQNEPGALCNARNYGKTHTHTQMYMNKLSQT